MIDHSKHTTSNAIANVSRSNSRVYSNYDAIDIAKFVFAFAVIAIHTELLHGVTPVVKWAISSLFLRIAVPFFMITSSFFLGRKIRGKGVSCVKQYRMKLYPVFLLYCGINTILHAVVSYHNTHNIHETIFLTIKSMIFYPKGAMWFILALIVSSFMLEFILINKINPTVIYFASFVLYSFALVCNNYYFLIESTDFSLIVQKYMDICICARNGLFLFIYMLIGYLISSPQIMNLSTKYCILSFLIGYATMILETAFIYGKTTLDDNSLFISQLVVIPSMILLLTKFKKQIHISRSLRNISTVVYYVHPVFSIIIGVYIGFPDGFMKFAIVSSLSIIVWYLTKDFNNNFIYTFLR